MRLHILPTIILAVTIFLGSCDGPAASTPEAPTPTNTPAPTPTPIPPSITELIINGTELDPQGMVFEIPEEVNPGDTLDLAMIVQDDEGGTVEVFGNTTTYAPSPENQAGVQFSLVVPPDLTSNEIPLRLALGEDTEEYVMAFEPGSQWAPWVVVEDPTGLTGEVALEVRVIDLNGNETAELTGVEQEFNYQDTGNKEITEYISNQDLSPFAIERLNDGLYSVRFNAEWPGRFPLHLTAIDANGNESTVRMPVEVYWAEHPFEIRGVMISGWHPDGTSRLTSEDFVAVLDRLVEDNVNFVSINPGWYLESLSSNEFIRNPQVDNHGEPTNSITDEQTIQLIELAHERNMGVLIKPMVWMEDWSYIGYADPSNPEVWFDNYKNQVLIPMATLAADNDVEMLSLFNDPGNQNEYRSIWINIIQELRNIYGGEITLAEPRFPSIYRVNTPVTFSDQLDVYGFQYYLPGSGYPEYPLIPGKMDPTVDEMVRNISPHFDARENEIITLGIQAIATEFGTLNFDGANRSPGDMWYETANRIQDNQEQVEFYEASLRVFSGRPWMDGLFVWSVMPSELIYYFDGQYTNDFRGLPVEDMIRIWFYTTP